MHNNKSSLGGVYATPIDMQYTLEEFCLTYVTILTIIIVTATTLGTRITMLIGTAMNNISDIHH